MTDVASLDHAARPLHDHVFLGGGHGRNERRIRLVVVLTLAMMVGEIVAGLVFGSVALLADGLHMATHAGALAVAAIAYAYARRHQADPRFSFGTGKVGDLAAFASAIVLGMVALLIAFEAFARLAEPVPIRFGEAIGVAVLGLVVNVASAFLLRDNNDDGAADRIGHSHHHGHHGSHDHGHDHHTGIDRDHNLRAAYLHVIADALTSVLAIAALLAGSLLGWLWMDPAMALVGSALIAHWSFGLGREASAVLLDVVPDAAVPRAIRRAVETDADRVCDLHVWRLGPGHMGAVISIASPSPLPSETYRERLSGLAGLSHVTIEVVRA